MRMRAGGGITPATARATGIFRDEPIDIHVDPRFLPEQIAADYDKLWTPRRMKQIVDGLAANRSFDDRATLTSRSALEGVRRAASHPWRCRIDAHLSAIYLVQYGWG